MLEYTCKINKYGGKLEMQETNHRELSKQEGTIGYIIGKNRDKIDATTTKEELFGLCEQLLWDSDNNGKVAFLYYLERKKTYEEALQFVYDYYFRGDGYGVITKRRFS